MKIMIVEKDELFRLHLAERLNKEGFEVESAGSLALAQKSLAKESFAAMTIGLTDFGRQGLLFLENISAITPETKVVLINRRNDLTLSIEAMTLGACAEVAVPVDIAALADSLKRCCRR